MFDMYILLYCTCIGINIYCIVKTNQYLSDEKYAIAQKQNKKTKTEHGKHRHPGVNVDSSVPYCLLISIGFLTICTKIL